MFWAVLIPIVFVGAVLYVIHQMRRSAEDRRQRSEERAAALLASLERSRSGNGGPGPLAAAAGTAPAHPPPASELKRRARILTDAQRMLYLILRAAMPDHLIMPHVRVLDLLEVTEGAAADERDARLRTLARERLDFLVCDGDLVPVAAIVLYAASIGQIPDESAKIGALRELGVRFLRFRADSLPRPAELRHLVLG